MAKAQKNAPPEPEIIEEEAEDTRAANDDDRREQRYKEWGDQFDIWLIRAAKKQRAIVCIMDRELPGVTTNGNVLEGIPLRVDKFNMQIQVDQEEIWIERSMMKTAKHAVQTVKTKTESESLSA